MRVLVLGSGGREHALARALSADTDVTGLHVAPGNPGIARIAQVHPVTAADPASVTALAQRTGAGLVVIGPEAPLVAGVADAVRAAGISCFGPGAAAAVGMPGVHDVLGEGLGPLDHRGRGTRPEAADPGGPDRIGDPGDQGRLRPDHH